MVAEAALDVLTQGGNAVDAAVTGAMVQGVIDPLMCGPGGYGVMTIHEAASRRTTVLDFFGLAPRKTVEGASGAKLVSEFSRDYGYIVEGGENEVGYRSIATPGTIAGLALALEQFGSTPWATALGPAHAVARDGYQVTQAQHEQWNDTDDPDKPGNRTRLAFSDSGRTLYFDGTGGVRAVGETIRNSELASTIERLMRAGADDFYTGELAAAIVADLQAGGSDIDAEDLRAFRPNRTAPLAGSYRGRRILVPGFPGGGLSIIQALQVLELLQRGAPPVWIAGAGVLPVAAALGAALEDKYTYLAGPRDTEIPLEFLLSAEHTEEMARSVQAGELLGASVADAGFDRETASTTHIAVIDDHGNAAAVTHTLASGSGVITAGLGFMFNNFMHGFDPRPGRWNSLRPGATRPASMSPGLVLDSTGELLTVFGASGSTRIVSSLVQVLAHMADRGWDALRAVSAPRMNVQRGGSVQLEGRFPAAAVRRIGASGREAERYPRNYDPYFGKVHILTRAAADQPWDGAADPRADGGVALLVEQFPPTEQFSPVAPRPNSEMAS
jgi:gamma-glutamyltranspeptidase/glutathione hydrolase